MDEIEQRLASLKMLLAGLEVETARLSGIERVTTEQRAGEVRRQIADLEQQADDQYAYSPESISDIMPDSLSPTPVTDGIREQIAGLRRDVNRLQAQVDVLVTDMATMKADLRYVAQELSQRRDGFGLDSRLGLIVLIISTVLVFVALLYFNSFP